MHQPDHAEHEVDRREFSLFHSKIAPLLAKHSLATIVHISDDRSSVHVAYPSEPILAEASARYTVEMKNRKKVLAHVFAAFNSTKLLDPPRGDTGEMCAAPSTYWLHTGRHLHTKYKNDEQLCSSP